MHGPRSRFRHRLEITIFVVIAVVGRGPGSPADITKLVLAPTSDMVTPLVLLNHHLALGTLPVVQILLEKIDLLLLTVPLVNSQQTLTAKLLLARIAHHRHLPTLSHYPLAVLPWTEFHVGVFRNQLELVDFPVVFLHIRRQILEKDSRHVQSLRTPLVRTANLLKIAHLVNHIVVQARLAKTVHVLALTHVHVFVLLFSLLDLSFTNLADSNILNFVDHIEDATAHDPSNFRPVNGVPFHDLIRPRIDHLLLQGLLHKCGHPQPVGARPTNNGGSGVLAISLIPFGRLLAASLLVADHTACLLDHLFK